MVPEIRFSGFTDPWELRKLGDEVIEICAGGDIDKSKTIENGKYPIYANALTNDGIVGYYDNYYRVKAPAVTVTGRGEVGFAQARMADFTPVVRLLAIRSNHDCYFLENAINNHKIVIESTGVPQLTIPQLSSYCIFFSRNDEEEIRVGEYFHKLSNLITLHQRKLEKLKTFKKAMLDKMFPKNGELVPEIRFSGFTDPWEQCKLKDFADYKSSSLTAKDCKEEGKYDLYDANQIIGKTDNFVIDKDYITIIKDGAGVGRTRKLPKNTAFIGTMGALTVNNSDLDFLYATLNRIDWNTKTSGSTIPHIYFKDYGEEVYGAPSIEEQKKIGLYFKNIDYLITLHQRKLEKLQNLKKSMLNKMFI